jgi:hypothetical protein
MIATYRSFLTTARDRAAVLKKDGKMASAARAADNEAQ